jgi:hypothetical protein
MERVPESARVAVEGLVDQIDAKLAAAISMGFHGGDCPARQGKLSEIRMFEPVFGTSDMLPLRVIPMAGRRMTPAAEKCF